MGRGLAPGSSNQDVNRLSECLSIQSCRGFLPIKKWDQRSQQLAEMENALVQLHGLKKVGVLRRKLWIEKEQQVEHYFQEREREWAEEEERLQRQKLRLSYPSYRSPGVSPPIPCAPGRFPREDPLWD
ncbi:hypothetical protein Y1Q_0009463 [Alligator mississippiensis]|uniref:Uncharacterized protein n=1 Tax=Alligator mississippiensis TaxID=8496 RepID=A0A151NL76_ALLMI|nr:hypothetical protein Y1Q_0009463 [Alligator mississippiensis]